MSGPFSVLIVEDVADMRELVRNLLQAADSITISGTASSVLEARAELLKRRPDVVLLDEILPGESSQELIQLCREQGIPVVLMTGVETPTHKVPEGVRERVQKPGWGSAGEDRARLREALLRAVAHS